MNKSDMLKAAQKAEEYGVDPDTIMVTYTLDEFAESHGDEVDTFDTSGLRVCLYQFIEYFYKSIQACIDFLFG